MLLSANAVQQLAPYVILHQTR